MVSPPCPPPENLPVHVAGPVVLDVVMGELEHAPHPGQEQQAATCTLAPGGAATQAVALRRLGTPVSLVCYLGSDPAGILVEHLLHEEEVGLSQVVRASRQPVTGSLAFEGEHTITRFGSPEPPPLFLTRSTPSTLVADLRTVEVDQETIAGWRRGAARTWVLAGTGWDSSGRWDPRDLSPLDHVDVFTPGEAEALHCTRTEDPCRAARLLASRVPTVVVTRGAEGVVAVDDVQEVRLPAPRVPAVDPAGAGDVLRASLAWGHVHNLDLRQSLSLACLAAALSTTRPGGAMSAPTLSQVAHRAHGLELPKGYDLAFLDLLDGAASGDATQPATLP